MEMRNALTLMAQGHEIWLEKGKIEDGIVELALIYGHNMRADGIADPKKITPIVYSPDGAILEPALTSKEDHHLLTFQAGKEGYYTTIADLASVILSQTKEGAFDSRLRTACICCRGYTADKRGDSQMKTPTIKSPKGRIKQQQEV